MSSSMTTPPGAAANQSASIHSPWPKIDRLISGLQTTLAVLAGLAVIAMVLLVFLDAVSRTLIQSPIRGTLEVVSYVLLPLSVFGAYAYAHAKNQHISMTLFSERLAGKPSVANRVAIEAVTLACVSLIFVFGLYEASGSVQLGEANVSLITVPIWPAKIFMCIGLAVFGLQSLLKLVTYIREYSQPSDAAGKATS